MTTKQKKRVLLFLGILFAISFCLPVASPSSDDILLGFYCVVWGVVTFMVDLSSGDFQSIILDILLMLPNLLMILVYFYRKKFSTWFKYFLFFVTLVSAGSWIFTFRLYLHLDDGTNLSIGYWIWFLSISAYMLVSAMPSKKTSLSQN